MEDGGEISQKSLFFRRKHHISTFDYNPAIWILDISGIFKLFIWLFLYCTCLSTFPHNITRWFCRYLLLQR